ncbi:MAG: LysE family translocator [Chloracidobacterium sp.]|nr:LysE family translocator [Chloracidobacterium sp.]
MPNWSTLSLFITAVLVLVFMPGPNTLYIIARSIQQGRLAGFLSSLGIQVGSFFHIAAAAFGMSALLLSSALAFNAVKYFGAAYLIYLGVKTLWTRENPTETKTVEKQSLSRAFHQGIFVNLLNPKAALFFLAFLPQFVDSRRGSVTTQIMFLGSIVVVLGALSDSIYALLAGSAGNLLRGNPRLLRAQRYFAGIVYIGLGAASALIGSAKKG